MQELDKFTKWACEIQSIAQSGLAYCKNIYDIERFERLRDISAEMIAEKSGVSLEKVKTLFCNESGYQTPKIDTRAAIFDGDKILLVCENNGRWSLPGGWCDADLSVEENTIKETREEAGLDVRADMLIAVQDRKKHNTPPYVYGIIKTFMLCTALGGEFKENSETVASGYFAIDELPEDLAEEKVSRDQIEMCFRANADRDNWKAVFD